MTNLYSIKQNFFYTAWWNLTFIENVCFFFLLLFFLGLFLQGLNKWKTIYFFNILIFLFTFTNFFVSDFQGIFGIFTNLNYNFFYNNLNININTIFFAIIASFLASLTFFGFSDVIFSKDSLSFEAAFIMFFSFFASIFLMLSCDFICVIIGFECISLCSYVLVGLGKKDRHSVSAGIRYLLMSTIPSGLFVLSATIFYQNFATFYKSGLELILNSYLKKEHVSYFLKDATVDYTLNSKNSFTFLEDVSLISKIAQLIIDMHLDYSNVFTTEEKLSFIFLWLFIFSNSDILTYTEVCLAYFQYWINETFFDIFRLFVRTNAEKIFGAPLEELLEEKVAADACCNKIVLETDIYMFIEDFADELSIILRNQQQLQNQNQIQLQYYTSSIEFQLAFVCMLIVFFYKLAVVPLHVWAPEIYNTAPTTSVTFISTFIKFCIFYFVVDLISVTFFSMVSFWGFVLYFAGVSSVAVATIGAFNEKYIKKFITYSSIGHVGFLILGIPFFTQQNTGNVLNYIMVYTLSSLLVWNIFLFSKKHVKFLTNLQNILAGDNVLKIIFILNLFSLAGLPPFAGFFVKFDVLYALLSTGSYAIAIFVLITTIGSFFYYLKIIKIILFDAIQETPKRFYFNNMRLLLISFLTHIIIFFMLFADESFFFILKQIFTNIF